MTSISSLGAHVFMTAYLLCLMGCVAQKVYFDCGAKVDVVDAQGLILSPGFPYNYSSGTHCVWQFFVPVDYQLILEMFDFDVFESHEYSSISSYKDDDDDGRGELTNVPNGLALDEPLSEDIVRIDPKIQQSSPDTEVEPAAVHEESTKVSNSAKRSIARSFSLTSPPTTSPLIPGAMLNTDKRIATASSSHSRAVDFNQSSIPTMTTVSAVALPQATDTTSSSPKAQRSGLDACPHDVLYISDLVTFSSRFCGSNRPPRSQLVFGSSREMVEVIMELITTTHWGRGFALLFHYNNMTEPGGERRSFVSASAAKADTLLAAASGAAFFALILTSVLCVVFRPKMCRKRERSRTPTGTEIPEAVQDTRAELSELQPMAENRTDREVTADQESSKYSPPRTVSAGGDAIQNTELDLSSSGLAELDFGPDEVFIISAPSPNKPSFSPHTQRERFLRHSDTGPSPVGDWPRPDSAPSSSGPTVDGSGGCARPRAWSVRTFQEFLPPLPQLHKKWCSWNSTSPFTKLVDSAPPSLGSDKRKVFSDVELAAKSDTSTASDSSVSNASYPLARAAQRQRRLNSVSNLRRSRFTGPCFGLLPGTADAPKAAQSSQPEPDLVSSPPIQRATDNKQAAKRRDFPSESDHVIVPVFAICEEEDRQPLVSAEHLGQTTGSTIQNGLMGGTYDSKVPAGVSLQNQRVRPERKPRRSQGSGGVCPQPSDTPTDRQSPHDRPSALCRVTNHV